MVTNEQVRLCDCGQHAYTSDPSGKHTLIVEIDRKPLLQNTGWSVSPVNRTSNRLHARATSNAPGIRKGQLLHRLIARTTERRRVRAENGNLLDCRRANLQSLSRSDVAILNRQTTKDKLIGVTYAIPPRWIRSAKHYHARIRADEFLGSFKTREEAACCWDAAARRLYGWREATTNAKLYLIAPKVMRTKVCRLAARVGKRKIDEHRNQLWMVKYEDYKANPTTANFLKLGKQAFKQLPVIVKSFATGAEVFVEPQVSVIARPNADTATVDTKREKRERQAARRTCKAAKQIGGPGCGEGCVLISCESSDLIGRY